MTGARGNVRLAVALAGIVVLMGALSFAAVPLYDWFCRVTGYGGTTNVAAGAADKVLDRTIRVRFDASVSAGMPWSFRPVEREMEMRIGETALAWYEAHNPTSVPVAGTASYNVVPFAAGSHFIKIACFCFEEQVLEPGQTVRMPVSFYVDPAIVDDPEAKHVKAITLSYTFHRTPLPKQAERRDGRTELAEVN
ncbi:MAG TPA: cytochrome c oxidase assembly protein [Paracoccaceae bacterium]|nr:cytochrome c oxidase assembly protein [Paracoccaceae bacterium]